MDTAASSPIPSLRPTSGALPGLMTDLTRLTKRHRPHLYTARDVQRAAENSAMATVGDVAR